CEPKGSGSLYPRTTYDIYTLPTLNTVYLEPIDNLIFTDNYITSHTPVHQQISPPVSSVGEGSIISVSSQGSEYCPEEHPIAKNVYRRKNASFSDSFVPNIEAILDFNVLAREQMKVPFLENMKDYLLRKRYIDRAPPVRIQQFAHKYEIFDGLM